MYKILDLFSGLGGFSLGLERTGHFKTIAFCDNDKFSKLILDKHWKGVKIYDNVKEITKEKFVADGIQFPDIITGGFPCQPFSVAGKQKGTSDDRHLWPEMFRIIQEFKPRWVIGENVKGLINLENGMVFETVCTDLEGEGYEVRAFNIPAAGVGAPHKRERIWIVANSRRTLRERGKFQGKNANESEQENAYQYQRSSGTPDHNVANSKSKRTRKNNEGLWSRTSGVSGRQGTSGTEEDVADTHTRLSNGSIEEVQSGGQTFDTSSQRTDVANTTSKGLERQFGSKLQGTRERFTHGSQTINGDVANANSQRQQEQCGTESVQKEGNESQCSSSQARHTGWESEPDVGRVAHGLSGRVHRLKALGNSIVPKIAEEIGRAIAMAERKL